MRKNKSKKKPRNTVKIQSRLWLDGLLAFLVVVLMNVFVFGYLVKIDVTQDNRYSFSPVSKEIIEDISGDFKIKYFTSKEYPQDMIPTVNAIGDALEEIEDIGGGNIQIETLYPKDDEDAKKQAEDFQIPPLTYNVIEDDKASTSDGYSGLTFLYRDRQIAIPILTNEANLEYQLISIIKKVSSTENLSVGFVTVHQIQSTSSFQSTVQRQYNVYNVNLESVPDVDVLVVAGAREDFTEEELYNLDQYILGKKKVIFLVDGAGIDGKTFDYTEISTNVHDFIRQYGFEIEPGFIADFSSHERVSVNEAGGQTTQDYPLWVKVDSTLNREHPITSGIRSFVIPWGSEVVLTDGVLPEFEISSTSSSYVFTQDELSNYAPKNIYEPSKQLQEPRRLGAYTKAGEESYFSGRSDFNQREGFIGHAEDVEILVVGSSSIVGNGFMKSNPLNANMLLSTVDYMLNQDTLSEVREKSVFDRPLNPSAQKQDSMLFSILAVSALVVTLMVAMLSVRKYLSFKARKRYV